LPVQGYEKGVRETLIKVRRPDGTNQLIPLDWTDQVVPPVALPGARLVVSQLLLVCQRLEALLSKPLLSGTLALVKDTQLIGGSDEFTDDPIDLVASNRAAPGAVAGGSGSDTLTPIAAGKEAQR
jgi:hypothetical protein